MNFLLDTCVISELVARRPNARVIEWIDGIEEEHLYLSVVTIGEIGKGIAKLKDAARAQGIAVMAPRSVVAAFRRTNLADQHLGDAGVGTACRGIGTARQTDAGV